MPMLSSKHNLLPPGLFGKAGISSHTKKKPLLTKENKTLLLEFDLLDTDHPGSKVNINRYNEMKGENEHDRLGL